MKPKRKHIIGIMVIAVLILFVSCSTFQDTDKLVSEMTKSDLLLSVLVMSIIGSAIGS